jgi:hypothetical protein
LAAAGLYLAVHTWNRLGDAYGGLQAGWKGVEQRISGVIWSQVTMSLSMVLLAALAATVLVYGQRAAHVPVKVLIWVFVGGSLSGALVTQVTWLVLGVPLEAMHLSIGVVLAIVAAGLMLVWLWLGLIAEPDWYTGRKPGPLADYGDRLARRMFGDPD